MKILPGLTLAIWLVLASTLAFAQSRSEKIVFQKVLPQNQTLTVLETEMPYVISPEVKALGPNAHEVIPDHVYLYTFQLQSGKQTKILWTPTRNHLDGAWFSSKPAMKVMDAIMSEGKLCIVYNQTAINYAEVITPGAPLNKPGIPWRDSMLIRDGDPTISIVSAIISGSLEKNDLAVELKNYDGKHFRYRLVNNKWVNADPLPTGPPSETKKP